MNSNKTIQYLFFTLLFFSAKMYSQSVLKRFENRINFEMLNEIVKMSANDSISVSNSMDKSNPEDYFYFYNTESKSKIISTGFQVAYPFVGNSAIVKYKNYWGLIDRSGKFIYYKNATGVKLSSYEKYAIFYNDNSNTENSIFNLRDGLPRTDFIGCAEPAGPDYFIVEKDHKKYNLINRETKEPVFKVDVDSIILQKRLIYEENLVIVKQKNGFGLFLSNGRKISEKSYAKARFLGKYIMFLENGTWNYYVFENNKLNLITTTKIECITPAYQRNAIGVFMKKNRYNILKTNGEILSLDFDYINSDGTFGINGNSVIIFTPAVNYFYYYTDDGISSFSRKK
ncbi:hypothetical protein [Chryseobacterium sp. c4a]|uniref:hypothetical protein n=1 Tax=Chryseobacterium sp. c4a TaxID=1573582 RepID=UPI00135C7465|nr:hypothetical protein [Chryseobacterium sp. c4a]